MKKIQLFWTLVLVSGLLMGCNGSVNVNSEIESSQSETVNNTETEQTEQPENDVINHTVEYNADITHDGKDELIRVMIHSDGSAYSEIGLYVFDEKNNTIYEQEIDLHPSLGTAYYLVSFNEKIYLMNYNPLFDHDEVTCSYEVFSFDANGNKVVLDSDTMAISVYDVEKMDKDAWKRFAGKENEYFKDAFLLVSTLDGELDYSDSENKKTYQEEFLWILSANNREHETIDEVLDAFVAEWESLPE